MMQLPDDPIVMNMMRTGHPDGKEEPQPICPVCGEECDTLFLNDGQIVGCENCVETRSAWDLLVDE